MRSQFYFDEWRKLLNGPLDMLLSAIVEESEWMTAMRQASPFAGVLSPQERWAIYEQFDPRHAGTGHAERT